MRFGAATLEGYPFVAKDKKKKKQKKDKKDKAKGGAAEKAVTSLKALTQNPVVADIVAAALVATASALKDSTKARRLASEAGDEISKLSEAGAEKGNALWEMALEIGRRSLEELARSDAPKRSKAKAGGQDPRPNGRAGGG
jgi:hypothetical protein